MPFQPCTGCSVKWVKWLMCLPWNTKPCPLFGSHCSQERQWSSDPPEHSMEGHGCPRPPLMLVSMAGTFPSFRFKKILAWFRLIRVFLIFVSLCVSDIIHIREAQKMRNGCKHDTNQGKKITTDLCKNHHIESPYRITVNHTVKCESVQTVAAWMGHPRASHLSHSIPFLWRVTNLKPSHSSVQSPTHGKLWQ